MKRARKQKLLAIWGSPGSGKTTLAAKLAWQYGREGLRTALVFCDWSTPMLPCVREEGELLEQHSLGSIFAARRIVPALVEANASQIKGAEQLRLYGLLKGEYETLYPPVSERQAEEFLRSGRVSVNGRPARASYEVKEGDQITLRLGAREVTVEVLSVQETVRQADAAALYRQLS